MRGIEGDGLPVKDYVRFVKSVTPFQNLFWTEMAANYMLFNGFMEMADPGYMSRTQRKLKKDYDQEFAARQQPLNLRKCIISIGVRYDSKQYHNKE